MIDFRAILGRDQLDRIVAACETPLERTIIGLLAEEGLRPVEIARITGEDIGDDHILVDDARRDTTRRMSVSPETIKRMRELAKADKKWPVVGVAEIASICRAVTGRAGVEASAHLIRHSVMGRLVSDGWTLERLRERFYGK